ncbi:MAG: PhoX family phosphatase [Pseudomonadota bacterium]
MIDDDSISNNSTARPFQDILHSFTSRRKILAGGMGVAATSFFGASVVAAEYNEKGANGNNKGKKQLVGFTPVPVAGGGGLTPRISPEYNYDVIIPWGDPIAPGSLETIGIGHDGMHFFPLGNSNDHGLLVINHEYGDNIVVLGKNTPSSLDDVRTSQYAHGVAVIELEKTNGSWNTVNTGGYARRIHVNTPVTFSGPVAGSALLENPAGNQPKGTVNNCANGYTPWGTYLTCEENFNGYFGSTGVWARTEAQRRYGFSAGSAYGWHLFDERFDLSNPDYVNEDKRFGWILEVDPLNPDSVPVKRTALGRFKHEGIAITEGLGGRIVGYMGDDERNDYIYKFVSEANWKSMRAKGKHPLDHGKLYVAKFNDNGTGNWLELTIDNPVLAAKFNDQAEVLIFARQASDFLGATPMDRPEWTTVAPNGLVYCTLTNNTARTTATAPNPQAPNPDGHIIRWLDSNHHVGLTFNWDIFVLASSTHGTEESFASPDGLWADPDGRLFIQTDGRQHDGLNDQLLVADIGTGEIKRLFESVFGAEVTGITATPDRRSLFFNLQHPSSETTVPRDATIVISRKDGGIVGS